jgi:hypothetical protein
MQAPGVAQVAELPLRCRDDGVSGGAVPGAVLPGEAVPDDAVLPVLPALQELLPGGLRRGSVVATGPWGLLCLALAAGASAAGAWCAVVGLPQLGVAAAADAGLNPGRMLLIADGRRWWLRCSMAASWCSSARLTGRPLRCVGGSRPPCAVSVAFSW